MNQTNNLVELLHHPTNLDIFYCYGDHEQSGVNTRPVGAPTVVQDIPLKTPYIEQLKHFKHYARGSANAFILGRPRPSESLRDDTYDVPIQYCRISDADHDRASGLEKPDKMLNGFF